jgi:ABC-type sulfate/molybdate transport systems ATPase subunit
MRCGHTITVNMQDMDVPHMVVSSLALVPQMTALMGPSGSGKTVRTRLVVLF